MVRRAARVAPGHRRRMMEVERRRAVQASPELRRVRPGQLVHYEEVEHACQYTARACGVKRWPPDPPGAGARGKQRSRRAPAQRCARPDAAQIWRQSWPLRSAAIAVSAPTSARSFLSCARHGLPPHLLEFEPGSRCFRDSRVT